MANEQVNIKTTSVFRQMVARVLNRKRITGNLAIKVIEIGFGRVTFVLSGACKDGLYTTMDPITIPLGGIVVITNIRDVFLIKVE